MVQKYNAYKHAFLLFQMFFRIADMSPYSSMYRLPGFILYLHTGGFANLRQALSTNSKVYLTLCKIYNTIR